MNRRLVYAALAGAALLAGFALLLPTLDLTDTRFSAYGNDDEDASLLVNGLRQQGYEVAALTMGTSALDGIDQDQTDAVYLAVGPERGYTGAEARTVETFIMQGGTAIVLDDTGASDGLLERFGLEKGHRLLSTEGNPSVVQATIQGSLVNLWEPVELLVPEDAEHVTVLAEAGNRTVKDASGTGEIDEADPSCRDGCPLVVSVDHGEGTLIVVGDATFATNRYAEGSGVIGLVTGLATDEAPAQRALVVMDESRHVSGASEIGLTVFRVLTAPLSLQGVAYGLSGLIGGATAWSLYHREDQAWPEHDPGLQAPYMGEAEEGEP